jgi:hypothetical protein
VKTLFICPVEEFNVKQLIEYKLPDQSVILIEVEKPRSDEQEERSGLTNRVNEAKKSFLESLDTLKPVIGAIYEKVSDLNNPAHEVEVKFGVKLTGEVDGLVITLGGEASFEITLHWKNPS